MKDAFDTTPVISLPGSGDREELRGVAADVFDLAVHEDLVREFLDDPRRHR